MSGPVEQIAALRDILAAERIVGQILDINYPFHHRLIENAKDDFLEDMAQIALRSTQIPFISTVTGGVLAGQQSRPRLLVEQPSRTRLLPAGDEYRDRSRLQPVRRDRTSSDPDLLPPRHIQGPRRCGQSHSVAVARGQRGQPCFDRLRAHPGQWRCLRPAQGLRPAQCADQTATSAVRAGRHAARVHKRRDRPVRKDGETLHAGWLAHRSFERKLEKPCRRPLVPGPCGTRGGRQVDSSRQRVSRHCLFGRTTVPVFGPD